MSMFRRRFKIVLLPSLHKEKMQDGLKIQFKAFQYPLLDERPMPRRLQRARIANSDERRRNEFRKSVDASRREADAILEAWDGGRLFQVKIPGRHFRTPGKRGECNGFTPSSRRNLQRKCAMLDTSADSGQFVGLTYPDSIVEKYHGQIGGFDSFVERAKDDLAAWIKRLQREVPGAATLWRIEVQDRKSGRFIGDLVPHFHLLVFNIPYTEYQAEENQVVVGFSGDKFLVTEQVMRKEYGWKSSRCANQVYFKFDEKGQKTLAQRCLLNTKPGVEDSDQITFRDWLSASWYDVVDSHELAHLAAGTSCSRVLSSKGVSCYASKLYLSKDERPDMIIKGRNWGITNRKCIPWAAKVEKFLSPAAAYRVRRVMRRYLKHQPRLRGYFNRRGCGMSLFCDVHNWLRLVAPPPDCPF